MACMSVRAPYWWAWTRWCFRCQRGHRRLSSSLRSRTGARTISRWGDRPRTALQTERDGRVDGKRSVSTRVCPRPRAQLFSFFLSEKTKKESTASRGLSAIRLSNQSHPHPVVPVYRRCLSCPYPDTLCPASCHTLLPVVYPITPSCPVPFKGQWCRDRPVLQSCVQSCVLSCVLSRRMR